MSDSNPLPASNAAELQRIRTGLSIADIGVIASLIISCITGGYVVGILQNQIDENTSFRKETQPILRDMHADIAEIKTGIKYLTQQQLEQRREKRKAD